MGKITLNEALKKASVKNDLQMFLGLDAQSELGGMTPERLAAVAGESIENLKFFRTDYIKPKETISDCTKIIENVIEGFQLKNGDKCSFSVLYDSIGLHHIYGFVYRVGDANYGIVHYDKRPKIWKIVEIENSRCTVIKE